MLVRFGPLAIVAVASFGVGALIAAGSSELDSAKRLGAPPASPPPRRLGG
jgi:hypothetical protein